VASVFQVLAAPLGPSLPLVGRDGDAFPFALWLSA
jgi:hypothetical protein